MKGVWDICESVESKKKIKRKKKNQNYSVKPVRDVCGTLDFRKKFENPV